MARLIGLIGNRTDMAGRVLALEAASLRVHVGAHPVGWGIGFHQSGEVLMRRRPLEERGEVDLGTLAADVRADTLIGHVRAATVGGLRTENTHPFRYRQWLFALTGTVVDFASRRDALLSELPQFLRSSVSGDTDAEYVFYLLLAKLHALGSLNELSVPGAVLEKAVCMAVRDVGRLANGDQTAPAINLLVADGERIVGVHGASAMAWRTIAGAKDADAALGNDATLRSRVSQLALMHFVLVASDFDDDAPPQDWTRVPSGWLFSAERGKEPTMRPL